MGPPRVRSTSTPGDKLPHAIAYCQGAMTSDRMTGDDMSIAFERPLSDSDLRQELIGTWRLISFHLDVDGTLTVPLGDAPQGYLVYTPDGHVFVQTAARDRRELFGLS